MVHQPQLQRWCRLHRQVWSGRRGCEEGSVVQHDVRVRACEWQQFLYFAPNYLSRALSRIFRETKLARRIEELKKIAPPPVSLTSPAATAHADSCPRLRLQCRARSTRLLFIVCRTGTRVPGLHIDDSRRRRCSCCGCSSLGEDAREMAQNAGGRW